MDRIRNGVQKVPELKTAEYKKWRTDGVRVVRAESLNMATRSPAAAGRATAFDFAGTGAQETWIGAVTLQAGGCTGAHHHGRTEVAVYVAQGRSQIRWGERLEFAAEIGPGDFVYFAPHVPHQELNLDERETVHFVVVRSNGKGIAVKLEVTAVESPETIY
jgi:uncharacterized RmlC-like cupin family protein